MHWLVESLRMAAFLILLAAFWIGIVVPVGFALVHFLEVLL